MLLEFSMHGLQLQLASTNIPEAASGTTKQARKLHANMLGRRVIKLLRRPFNAGEEYGSILRTIAGCPCKREDVVPPFGYCNAAQCIDNPVDP